MEPIVESITENIHWFFGTIKSIFYCTIRFVVDSIVGTRLFALLVEKLHDHYDPPSSSSDIEGNKNIPSTGVKNRLDFPSWVLGFCSCGGIGFVAATAHDFDEAPTLHAAVLLLIALSFSCLLVWNSIPENYPVAAGVLLSLSAWLAKVAVITALSIPLSVTGKCIVWVFFAACVIGVVIVRLLIS